MANFVVVIDSDGPRRSQYCTRIRPLIAPMEGLNEQESGVGDCSVVWAVGPRAPIDSRQTNEEIAVMWGRALPVGQSEPVSAAGVCAAWQKASVEIPAPWDGYFAAMWYSPGRGLIVGGDILGYFPLYYWSGSGVTLVGSSPELFRHHPCFHAELDPAGLAGILLVAQSVGGKTLLKGVRRLDWGHLLHVDPEGCATELLQYRMPDSTTYYDWPFA